MKHKVCENAGVSVVAIIQARMSSTRFPGKVLAPLAGQPSIVRQIERARRATLLDDVVVATSVDDSDDDFAGLLAQHAIPVYRGPLVDVLQRFVDIIEELRPQVVVRLTGDCPLTSPAVIDDIVSRFLSSDLDYASNSLVPSYPDGLDVEVMRADALVRVAGMSLDPAEREHVTLGIYRRCDIFRVANFSGATDLSDLRWTVDSPEDYEFVYEVYRELYEKQPAFDVSDILSYIARHPERSRTSCDSPRNAALNGLDTGAMNA